MSVCVREMSVLESIEVEHCVRVKQPKVVIFTFVGTLTPANWESHCFEVYANTQLREYLQHNWNHAQVYRLVQLIKQHSFDEHIVFENVKVPLVIPFDLCNTNWREVIDSVSAYVLWQFNQAKVTPESRCLVNLCLVDGYKQGKITTR